jgi:hypothetical protein
MQHMACPATLCEHPAAAVVKRATVHAAARSSRLHARLGRLHQFLCVSKRRLHSAMWSCAKLDYVLVQNSAKVHILGALTTGLCAQQSEAVPKGAIMIPSKNNHHRHLNSPHLSGSPMNGAFMASPSGSAMYEALIDCTSSCNLNQQIFGCLRNG